MTAITAGMPGWELAWLALGALGVLILAGTAVTLAGMLIGALIVGVARWLCDPGDGTPGHRHLYHAIADVDREHRPVRQKPLRNLVLNPALEEYAAWQASQLQRTSTDLTEVIVTDWDGLGPLDPDPRLGRQP